MDENEKSIRNAGWISLGEKEEIEAWSHPSIYPYIPVYLVGALLVLIGFFAPFLIDVSGLMRWAPLLLIPIGIFLILVEYIRYISVFYVFTSNRVVRKKGILRHRVRKVPYHQIDKTKKDLPLIGRVLGFGHLVVVTASPSEEDIRMDHLPQLSKATTIISDYRSKVSRAKRGVED